MPEETELTNRN